MKGVKTYMSHAIAKKTNLFWENIVHKHVLASVGVINPRNFHYYMMWSGHCPR